MRPHSINLAATIKPKTVTRTCSVLVLSASLAFISSAIVLSKHVRRASEHCKRCKHSIAEHRRALHSGTAYERGEGGRGGGLSSRAALHGGAARRRGDGAGGGFGDCYLRGGTGELGAWEAWFVGLGASSGWGSGVGRVRKVEGGRLLSRDVRSCFEAHETRVPIASPHSSWWNRDPCFPKTA